MKKKLINKFIIVFLVFLFSVSLRLWNLNVMGRVIDEGPQYEDGYNFIRLYLKGDFNNPYLYNHPDHPPLTKYLYGAASYLDIQNSGPKVNGLLPGEPTFNYDITYIRLVSVLFSSMTVVLVVLIAWELSPLIAVVSGVILSSLPIFVGLSQIASIESILIFFFTATVYSFFTLLRKRNLKWIAITGILLGLALETKYTDAMLYPLLLIFYFVYFFIEERKLKKSIDIKFLLIIPISIFVYFVLWPAPWFHLGYFINWNYQSRISSSIYSVPEVFYGKFIHVPKIYYVVMFFITTPLLSILAFFLGSKIISDLTSEKIKLNIFRKFNYKLPSVSSLISKSKTWLLISIIIWFCFPFLQSFYNFRQQGIRYIIQIYAPFSIISAIGIAWIISLAKRFWQKTLIIILIILYFFIPLYLISPYYLDYYNILVGGPKNVYEKRLFMLGWWGQDLRDSGLYIKDHAKKGASVGLAVGSFVADVPPLPGLRVEMYKPNKKFDYVMVSNFNIVREGFDPSEIIGNYKLIYSTEVLGAHLVDVYQKK